MSKEFIEDTENGQTVWHTGLNIRPLGGEVAASGSLGFEVLST